MPSTRRQADPLRVRDGDDAFIALVIAAMDASGHVSAEEAARAHDIIWATRRFRRRSGEVVDRRIDRMRQMLGTRGPTALIEAAARQLAVRDRLAAFAVAADIVLVDGRMARAESAFLTRLARLLGLDADAARNIRNVIRIKNSA
ncbi:MAG TPA: tellurite resistance TerB family protein [Vicinamibacterales bacterium]|nr:tellurite resistance TerB family protein [Vicinamibacterales bacterium]